MLSLLRAASDMADEVIRETPSHFSDKARLIDIWKATDVADAIGNAFQCRVVERKDEVPTPIVDRRTVVSMDPVSFVPTHESRMIYGPRRRHRTGGLSHKEGAH
jgi:hypothetical protein